MQNTVLSVLVLRGEEDREEKILGGGNWVRKLPSPFGLRIQNKNDFTMVKTERLGGAEKNQMGKHREKQRIV